MSGPETAPNYDDSEEEFDPSNEPYSPVELPIPGYCTFYDSVTPDPPADPLLSDHPLSAEPLQAAQLDADSEPVLDDGSDWDAPDEKPKDAYWGAILGSPEEVDDEPSSREHMETPLFDELSETPPTPYDAKLDLHGEEYEEPQWDDPREPISREHLDAMEEKEAEDPHYYYHSERDEPDVLPHPDDAATPPPPLPEHFDTQEYDDLSHEPPPLSEQEWDELTSEEPQRDPYIIIHGDGIRKSEELPGRATDGKRREYEKYPDPEVSHASVQHFLYLDAVRRQSGEDLPPRRVKQFTYYTDVLQAPRIAETLETISLEAAKSAAKQTETLLCDSGVDLDGAVVLGEMDLMPSMHGKSAMRDLPPGRAAEVIRIFRDPFGQHVSYDGTDMLVNDILHLSKDHHHVLTASQLLTAVSQLSLTTMDYSPFLTNVAQPIVEIMRSLNLYATRGDPTILNEDEDDLELVTAPVTRTDITRFAPETAEGHRLARALQASAEVERLFRRERMMDRRALSTEDQDALTQAGIRVLSGQPLGGTFVLEEIKASLTAGLDRSAEAHIADMAFAFGSLSSILFSMTRMAALEGKAGPEVLEEITALTSHNPTVRQDAYLRMFHRMRPTLREDTRFVRVNFSADLYDRDRKNIPPFYGLRTEILRGEANDQNGIRVMSQLVDPVQLLLRQRTITQMMIERGL